MSKKIAVIGLGKLGLCTALCLVKKGNYVLGYDTSKHVIESIKKRKFDNYEPDVINYLNKYEKKFEYSNSFNSILKADMFMLVLPTPSQKNKAFTNKYIYSFLKQLIKYKEFLNKKIHIVITSTVMPGSCNEFINYIEKKTNLKINQNFYLSYNPEFIALGSVIKDFLNPDMVLIGSSSKEAEKDLIMIYRKFVINKKISPMSLISAEITKISLNSFITLKISFANTLQRLCEKFKYANSYDVTDALGKDKRISNYYFRPGLPFAGPCFPRDNEALNYFQDLIGKKNKFITDATIQSNKEHVNFLNKKIINYIKKNKFKKILIYGLSFKPNTSLPERSYSLNLVNLFLKKKVNFKIFEKNINYNNGIYKKLKKFLITKKKINSKNFDLLIDVHSLKPKYKISKIDLWNLNF